MLAADLPRGATVHPVLCVVGAELPRRELLIDGVHVFGLRHLAQALTAPAVVLDAATVHRLADLARRDLGPPA